MASRDALTFRRGILWAADLAGNRPRIIAPRAAATFGLVDPSDPAPLIDTVRQMDRIDPEALLKRLEQGRQCYTMWVDGQVAAYGWLTRGPEWIGEFERELQVEDGEAYIWDCATLPAYRRMRLFSSLIGLVAEQLAGEGLRRLWIIGRYAARPMLHSVRQVGFDSLASLTYSRIFNRRVLLAFPMGDPSDPRIKAARRLLRPDGDHLYGPLITGNSTRPGPPATHIDR